MTEFRFEADQGFQVRAIEAVCGLFDGRIGVQVEGDMGERAMSARIPLDRERIAAFCRKWRVKEFSLFGSVLRDDFGPDSDVDVLVTFTDDARWGLFDLCRMEDELRQVFGQEVDLVTRRSVEESANHIRKKHILDHMEVLDVAG